LGKNIFSDDLYQFKSVKPPFLSITPPFLMAEYGTFNNMCVNSRTSEKISYGFLGFTVTATDFLPPKWHGWLIKIDFGYLN
jgi:hypothetical protein